jgi:glutaminase
MTAGSPDAAEPTFVSTGTLPPPEQVAALVDEAYERYRSSSEGKVSQVYPALARVPAHLFGICAAATHGAVHAAGDAESGFAIMSVAKPFVFALVCHAVGAERVRSEIGANATGLPFDSLAAIEQSADGRTNPMVNPGAIATASLVPGATVEDRWELLRSGLSRFAGRTLELDEEVFASASETNHRNRSLARALHERGRLHVDPSEAVELYTRQSCLSVTARDLAVMAACLADGGVNPVTGDQVVDADSCRHTLAVMTTAGLYESSGDWLYDIGLPGKSGIGGGIVTVAPGKGGLGTFAPLLDAAGNSVKGQLAARFLSRRLGLDLFVSQPEADPTGASRHAS